jgi:hypothetical protein
MASRKPKETPINGEVEKPDFAHAVKLYRETIRPAGAKVGEYNQESSQAYKEIKKIAHVQPAAAKAAFMLDNMEEMKRDDWLRSFNGMLNELRIYMPTDMVDQAEGKGNAHGSVVPVGEVRPKPKLVTMPGGHPDDDSDLVDAADGSNAQAAE